MLIWLYYSWDIAKGFYPKSANELCQVAKVNDSLLGLKYQFPIEEREFKSTSIIKLENKNLNKIINEIQNSQDLNIQQKTTQTELLSGWHPPNRGAQPAPFCTSSPWSAAWIVRLYHYLRSTVYN